LKRKIPPNQKVTKKFPRLDLGIIPEFNEEKWDLRVEGLVKNPMKLSYEDLLRLPNVVTISDFHCVTGWTRLNNKWEGVSFKTIIEMVEPRNNANYVTIECGEGYTTSLSLEEMMDDDVLLAYKFEDKPLPLEHGGPLRLVVPQKYGYKSAKWVRKLIFAEKKELGFWEKRGYSDSADPWKEERYNSAKRDK